MLTAYQNAVTRLLQYPAAPASLYQTADLTTWINSARQQLAAESQAVRVVTAIPVAAQTFALPILSASGIASVLSARNLWLTGGPLLNQWPFEYFTRYFLANSITASNATTDWAQLSQGSNGTIYLNPAPASSITINMDAACLPINLASDSDAEAIPYPWTDAVPYFAAYLALLSAQSAARQADAQRMFDRYTDFVNRARRFSNDAVLTDFSPQAGLRFPVPPAGVAPPARAA